MVVINLSISKHIYIYNLATLILDMIYPLTWVPVLLQMVAAVRNSVDGIMHRATTPFPEGRSSVAEMRNL